MAGIFQPVISDSGDVPIAPSRAVSNAPMTEAIGEGVSTFLDIATKQKDQEIVNDFQKRVGKIQQAAATSKSFNKDRFRLEINKLMADFKTSAPSLSSEFDRIISASGAGEKAIPKNAFEKGLEETQKRFGELAPLLGEEEAIRQIQLEAEDKKREAELKRKEREGSVVAGDYQEAAMAGISADANWFYNTLDSVASENPEGVDFAVLNQIDLELSQQEKKRLAQLRGAVREGANPKEINLIIEDVKKEYKDLRDKLENFDSYKVMTKRQGAVDARDTLVAREIFHSVNLLSKVSKDAAGVLAVSILKGNAAVEQVYKKNVPEMFRDPQDYSKNVISGMNKIMRSALGADVETLSEAEAKELVKSLTTQESLALGGKLATSPETVEVLATAAHASPNDVIYQYLKQVTKNDPQALAAFRSKSFTTKLQADYAKYGRMAEVGIDGAISQFVGEYFDENGKFPSGITVERFDPEGKFGVPQDFSVKGEGITSNMRGKLREVFETLNKNPSILRNSEKKLGLPENSLDLYKFMNMLVNVETSADSTKMVRNVPVNETPQGTVKESPQESPKEVPQEDFFNALEDSTPEEISRFREALRNAKDATEKAEVHAAFIDGAFRIAK